MSATTAPPPASDLAVPFKMRRRAIVCGRQAEIGEVVDLVELPTTRILQLERAGYGMRTNEPVTDGWHERAPREAVVEEPAADIADNTDDDLADDEGFGLSIEEAAKASPGKAGGARKAPAKARGATKKRGATKGVAATNRRR